MKTKQLGVVKAQAILGKNYRPLKVSVVPPRNYRSLEGVGVFVAWNETENLHACPLTTLDDTMLLHRLKQQLHLPDDLCVADEEEGSQFSLDNTAKTAAWRDFFNALVSAFDKIKDETYFITDHIDAVMNNTEPVTLTLAPRNADNQPITLPQGYEISLSVYRITDECVFTASTADGTIVYDGGSYNVVIPPQQNGLLCITFMLDNGAESVETDRPMYVTITSEPID